MRKKFKKKSMGEISRRRSRFVSGGAVRLGKYDKVADFEKTGEDGVIA